MSIFIVRFHALGPGAFSGEVREVSTGESARFTDARELLAFFEELHALSAPAAGERRARAAAGKGTTRRGGRVRT
jgi:hypothetical protein